MAGTVKLVGLSALRAQVRTAKIIIECSAASAAITSCRARVDIILLRQFEMLDNHSVADFSPTRLPDAQVGGRLPDSAAACINLSMRNFQTSLIVGRANIHACDCAACLQCQRTLLVRRRFLQLPKLAALALAFFNDFCVSSSQSQSQSRVVTILLCIATARQ